MLKIQKLTVFLLVAIISSPAWAQGAFRFGADERMGEWNMSLQAVYLDSASISGENGAGTELNDDWGFGFMLAYNFNNHLALGFEMSFLDPSYEATIVPQEPDGTPGTPEKISHKASVFNGLFKGTYNILSGPVTPFVDVQAGWRYLDSNVSSSPPTTGCWWDPWWGYVCRSYYSTYDDTSFIYGAGLGLRWDINRDMFLRGSWSWNKGDAGASDPTLEMGRLEIGWRY
jgi:opacity protein-like surface antigen